MTSIDIEAMRRATERLFAHRKTLRDKAVRIGFWPAGLRIGVGASIEVLPWDRLATISADELVAIVDRVAGATELDKLLATRKRRDGQP